MTGTCTVQPRILIADDQPDLIDALGLMLKAEGIQMESVTSPDATLAAVANRSYDLLLMDLNYTGDTTSGREGIDLLSRVRALDGLLPRLVPIPHRLGGEPCPPCSAAPEVRVGWR